MPHFICRWPGGDVLLASVDSRQELDTILQERCEPGVCKVARYHGPLVLELKPDVPGVSRASAEPFTPGPACPGFQPAWDTREASGDVELLAADGSSQQTHKLVLQCRLPVLQGQPIAADVQQVRLVCVPDMVCLHSLVQFLYLDEVQQEAHLTPQLHVVALACGLHRLVELCEARFAQQLEVQLLSLQGLCEAQRDAVLDSFIGWCLYSEQLQRQKLRQLCVHALARHAAAAQSRPTWSSLSEATASLVWLITASTAPPLIHRQIALDGAAVLPVPQNPAPAAVAASGPTVSVDAEAFAAAGGRLTTTEWQQLQKFRAAVTQSLHTPDASPLVLEQQQLQCSSFAAPAQPHMAFTVKQPVLGPHKRLMDSVCRFAFPATHGLLGAGWQIAAPQASLNPPVAPASSSGAGPIASAATPRPAGAVPSAGPAGVTMQAAVAATAGVASAASPAAGVPRQQAAAAMAAAEPSTAPEPHDPVVDMASAAPLVPVPVPDAQPLLGLLAAATAAGPAVPGTLESNISSLSASAAAAVAAAAAALAPDHSNSSCQQQLPRVATMLLAEQNSMRVSGSGSSNHAHQPGSPAGPSTSNNTSPTQAGNATPTTERQALSAGRYLLRSRNQSSSSAGGRRSSHLRSESLPHSWGSGVSPGTSLEAQPALLQGQEQQQQQQLYQQGGAAAALPMPVLQRLQGDDGSGCWGSGTVSLQTSLPGSPLRGNFAELQAALRRQQQHVQQGQQQTALQGSLQQATPIDALHRLAQQQQQLWRQQAEQQQTRAAGGQQQLRTADNTAIVSSTSQQRQQQRQQQQGQQQPHQLLQEPLCNVAPAAADASAVPALVSNSGHESTALVPLEDGAQRHSRRVLDLPAICIPGAAEGALHAAACSEGAQASPAPWATSTAPQAAEASALAAGDPAPTVDAPEAVNRLPSCDPLAALHRALVEDFVLYEEASAARQHVVGIVVSIEHGDQATGQRLLAPACAELIAATAPAAVPNRLGLSSNSAAASAADGAAAAAVRAANYMKAAKGLSKLLGMASVSRAAQEPMPAQLQRRQQQLFRALQRVGTQLPGLTRLLAAYNMRFATAAAAGTGSEAFPMEGVVSNLPVSPGPFAAQTRQPGVMLISGVDAAGTGAECKQELGSSDLEAALGELLSLPELAQGMPVLLTQQQYQQRQLQVQQLASRAAAMLAARDESGESGQVAAGGAALTASPPAAGPGHTAGQSGDALLAPSAATAVAAAAPDGPRDFQAGLLFSSILASLGAAVSSGSGPSAQTAAVPAARPTSAHLQSRLGGGIGQLGAFGSGTASVVPGAVAGSVLSPILHTGPLGLLGAGGAPGPADGLMAAAMGSAMHMGPAGGPPGVLTPTGMGALLAGGLLAEGGVAGDSIVEDMAADMLVYGAPGGRRITCNGMLELCAALARPASDHGGSPSAQQQQQAQQAAASVPAADAEPKAASVLEQNGESIQAGLTGRKRRRSSSGIEHGQSESKR